MKERGDAAPTDELVGQWIDGRYRIVALVALGAMARVYRAEQKGPPQELAIKVLGRDIAAHKTAAARFHREAKAASRLHHPGIVRIYDWGVDGEVPFIAMELLHGCDLFELLEREGRLTQDRAVRLAIHICDALQAAHDGGVVHRDLKPENVMVLAAGSPGEESVKLLDFGIAKLAPRTEHAYNDETFPQILTKVGSAVGTPSHMSPEQARGVDIDGRADLYALGVLLYEMVTGHLPFEGDNPIEVAVRQVREAPPPPSVYHVNIHSGLESIILKSLEKDPAARYQSARELAAELTRVLSDLTGEEAITAQAVGQDEDELPTRERDVRAVRELLDWLAPVRPGGTIPMEEDAPTANARSGAHDVPPTLSQELPAPRRSSPSATTFPDEPRPRMPSDTTDLRSQEVSLADLERSDLNQGRASTTQPSRAADEDQATLSMSQNIPKAEEDEDTTTVRQEVDRDAVERAIKLARQRAERLAAMEMRQSRTDVLEDHTDEGQPTPRLEDMGEPLPRYAPRPSDPAPSRRPGSGPYSVPRPRERDPHSELESLLQRVPARRPILPALLLVLAILVSAGLLYVAFFGVPKNIPYLRDVRRMLRI